MAAASATSAAVLLEILPSPSPFVDFSSSERPSAAGAADDAAANSGVMAAATTERLG